MMVLLGLLVVVVVAAVFHLPILLWLRRLLAWAEQLGPWGPAALGAMCVVAAVLLLPGSVLTIGTGFLYGVPLGFLVVWIGDLLGACIAFGIGRTVVREWVMRRMAGNEKFIALDEAVGEHGFKIVFLTRLSPVFPFGLLNYSFGASRVSCRQYVLGSLLGLIPGIVLYVYIGASLRSLAMATEGELPADSPLVHRVFFWFGLAATITLVVVATYIARRALAAAAPEHSPPGAAPGPGSMIEGPCEDCS